MLTPTNNYNIFSKNELADFLSKHENQFLYLDSPFSILIDKKIDDILQQIHNVNEEQGQLIAAAETAEDRWIILSALKKAHKKWKRLNAEYDKLSKLRFGE